MPRRNNRLVLDTSLPTDLIEKRKYCDIESFSTEDDAWDNIWATEKESDPEGSYVDLYNESYAYECSWCRQWHKGVYNSLFDN